LLVLLLFL